MKYFSKLCSRLICIIISFNFYEQYSILVEARINEAEVSAAVEKSLSVIPEWLKEYLEWHREQRLNHMNDPSTKFLTLACNREFPCGGVSDRLRPLPYFLLAAYKMKRVFMIKWEKYELEDFFLPPKGGLDWRMPNDFEQMQKRPYQQPSCVMARPGKALWPCNIWDRNMAEKNLFILSREDLYGENKDFFVTDARPHGTFGAIMRVLFEPTPPLAKLIEDSMAQLNVVPKKYLAAHFRYSYPHLEDRKAVMPKELRMEIVDNSVACVVHIAGSSDLPVYFTSDVIQDVQYMTEKSPYAAKSNAELSEQPVKVVALTNMNRFHSDDKKFNWEKDDPRDLYPVFIDLWLMGNSKCVSYGQGGFGMFGARLADEGCMIQHQKSWKTTECPSLP